MASEKFWMTAGFLRRLRVFPTSRVTCTSAAAAAGRSLKFGTRTALLGIRQPSLDWIDGTTLVDAAGRRAEEDKPEAADGCVWRRDSWTRTTLPFVCSLRRYSMAGVDWRHCVAAILTSSDDDVVKNCKDGNSREVINYQGRVKGSRVEQAVVRRNDF